MLTVTDIQERLRYLIGEKCVDKEVGEYKSLTIGFGKKISKPNPRDPLAVRCEWELGTYTAAWRVVIDNKVICGNMDPVDEISEINDKPQAVSLGALLHIEMASPFDIRVVMAEQSCIEFMCASSKDDEVFHIFGPNNFFASYSLAAGWFIRGE